MGGRGGGGDGEKKWGEKHSPGIITLIFSLGHLCLNPQAIDFFCHCFFVWRILIPFLFFPYQRCKFQGERLIISTGFSIVSVPDPSPLFTALDVLHHQHANSGSGDLPVHSMFLRHPQNTTIKATSTHLVNQTTYS